MKNKQPLYSTLGLIDIDKDYTSLPKEVFLTGNTLTIPQIVAVARKNSTVNFSPDKKVMKRIKDCHNKMIQNVKNGIPIYGCNTGYGAQASHVLVNGSASERLELAKKISEGISHIDVSVGPYFSKDIIRAGMLIRINMLMQGVSAVKIADLEIYRKMLNKNVTPAVKQYGGIGASGDLAHNCRVLSAARQLDSAMAWDKNDNLKKAKVILQAEKIEKLELDPKAGLGLVNGDNFSTALAGLLAVDTLQAFLIASVLGAMTVEVLKGTDRSFHPLLSEIRPHPGQKEIAGIYRYLLDGSKLAYQEMKGHTVRPEGIKVQDGYSLRGISQYHGVNADKIKTIMDTITINANSVSDNPLWVSPEYAMKDEEPWQWVSGGNFLAMHMVDVMDSLRKIMTQIVKLNDRHLGRIIDVHENNGLPANLSDKSALSQCAFKGVQIQSGMFDVYSSLLSIPVSTFFGVHEEGNQDITSHALTSGILGLENLRLVRYSLAQNMIALAQAVDLRGGAHLLSSKTKPLYEFIRSKTEYVGVERPLHNDIETIYDSIVNNETIQIVRKIFKDYQ